MPSFFLLILGACLLFGASIGIRMNYGILLNAYASQGNVPYDQISLVIAVGELIYGISQPIFGILAMKKIQRIHFKNRALFTCRRIFKFIGDALRNSARIHFWHLSFGRNRRRVLRHDYGRDFKICSEK